MGCRYWTPSHDISLLANIIYGYSHRYNYSSILIFQYQNQYGWDSRNLSPWSPMCWLSIMEAGSTQMEGEGLFFVQVADAECEPVLYRVGHLLDNIIPILFHPSNITPSKKYYNNVGVCCGIMDQKQYKQILQPALNIDYNCIITLCPAAHPPRTMGNNYSQHQHTLFLTHYHPNQPNARNSNPDAFTTSALPTPNPTSAQATLISKISANYISKLPHYYPQLYQSLPKSVLLWQIQQIQTWLRLIGMKSHSRKFRQLAVDGASIFLMDLADLAQEIGIKSELSLGIFQAWLEVGLKEYQKYVDQKQRENGKIKENTGNVESMNKMIASVNRSLGNAFREKQKQPQFLQSSEIKLLNSKKLKRNEVPKTLINTQKNKSVSIESTRQASESSQCNFSIKKLQIFDKGSNVCLQVQKFPKGMMEQFQNIYRQFGINISKQEKPTINQKSQKEQSYGHVLQQSTKNNLHLHRNQHKHQSLRKQLRHSIISNRPAQQSYSNVSSIYERMVERQYEQLMESMEVVIGRTTNSNNIDEYRFALMADPAYDINAGGFIIKNARNHDEEDIFGQHVDEAQLSMMYKKVTMTRRYQQEQEQTNNPYQQQEDNRKPQINAYMLLNEPTLIPQPDPSKSRLYNQQYLCRSYTESISGHRCKTKGKRIDIDGGWRFVIGEFMFIPQFENLGVDDDVEMGLNIAGSKIRLKINPNQDPQSNQTTQEWLYPTFYIISHPQSRYPQILKPPRLSQNWSKQRGYNKMSAIIYVREQRQYYLCHPNQVSSFINSRIRENSKNKIKRNGFKEKQREGTNKKQQLTQAEEGKEKKMYKSRGLRKKQFCLEQTEEKSPVLKYPSNRQEYNNSQSSIPEDGKIWIKLPIYPYSNKLTSANSIKIAKGTTLKLGRRQFIFNINTIILKYVDPWEKDKQGCPKASKHQTANNKCILCYERCINCLYLDCRHSVTCLPCGKMLEKCPICRNNITDYLRIYME